MAPRLAERYDSAPKVGLRFVGSGLFTSTDANRPMRVSSLEPVEWILGDLSLAVILLGAQVERCSRCVSFKNTYFARPPTPAFSGPSSKERKRFRLNESCCNGTALEVAPLALSGLL